MNRFVYLDNNATTKISESVRKSMLPFLDLQFGNPSSLYQHGAKVKAMVEDARKNFASLVGAKPQNIMFTAGGSESNCAAINSAFCQMKSKNKIVTTRVEHSSILEYAKILEQTRGTKTGFLNVDKNCNLIEKELEQKIDKNTAVVSIQFANNEVGTILLTSTILKKIKDLKTKFGFLFHIDAVQGLGKTPIDVKKLGADFVSFSGHKIHCPKGIGMLYVKDTKNFVPLIAGHQEHNMRGGTENVLGIVAVGTSSAEIAKNLPENMKKIEELRNYLEFELKKLNGVTINCKDAKRIPNTTSATFDNVDGNELMLKLETMGVCVSTGSACNSESSEPSHVLVAMGTKNPGNTIRVSLSEDTTKSQIDYFLNCLKIIYKGERHASNYQ